MSTNEVTPWYAGQEKPERPGVYQRLGGRGDDVWYARWDGVQWRQNAARADLAEDSVQRSIYQERPWRGLVEQAT